MNRFSFLYFLWTVFLIECLSAHEKLEEENGYIFTCPRSLKTKANNQLQLRRYGKLDAGVLKIKVTYQDSYSSNETLATEKEFDIEEGVVDSYLNLYLEPPENYAYNGKITINGTFGDYVIGGSDKVYFSESKDNIVFIQTDKPLYKEGQTVKFRVLRVDKDLKPSVGDKAEVWIEDASGTRLFQWKDVSLGKGIKQFEFPLADEPAHGDWKIIASFLGETTSTTFEVKEYVLPTFDVKIEQPSFVLSNAETIDITICAKYTYGKPVKGNLRMNISLETYAWSNDKLPTIEVEEKIDGCFKYPINVSLVETEDYYRYRRLQVVVSVEESATGVQRNETQYINRQYSPFSLSFNREQRQFYKPGLPYNGKLFVKNPDNTPTADEGIQICYTVTKERVVMDGKWKATRTVKYCQNYTSDEEGVIDFVIPRQNTDSVGINIEAKSLKYAQKSKSTNTHRQNSLGQPQTSMSLTPWFSPSGSFIQLQQVQETLLCGTKRNIKVLFTSKADGDYTFHYQVLSQGRVVQKGSVEKSFQVGDDVAKQYEDEGKVIDDVEVQIVPQIDSTPAEGAIAGSSSSSSESQEDECKSAKEARYVPPVGEVNIDIDIDASWSPSFYLLVYYIRDDRETVADSQKFNVEKCFKNQVKVQFGDEVKQPGTKTSIRVTSSPNSLCGLKVVDKSVSLLNSEDQLTPDKIFSILDSLDTGMYYGVNHCNEDVRQPGLYMSSKSILPPRPPQPWSSSSYEDSLAAFENCGFLVISDLVLFTRPCKSRGGGNNIVYEDAGFGSGSAYGGAVNIHSKVAMASTARRPAAPQKARPVSGLNAADKVGEVATKSVVDVRDYFPETWLFDLEMTGPDGTYLTKEKLPHTITEWVGSAICINEEDGLGLSNTTTIKGFQAFFISMTLPYSVIRGEKFWITVSVFSYVEDALPITVSLDKPDGFEIISESINKDICVLPGSSTNIKLQLEGTELGPLNLTVRAESAKSTDICGSETTSDALAKDAITKPIIVEAEGWPAEDVESVLYCPKDEENGVFKKQLSITEPEDVVPDSSRAYLDITGNVLGKSLDNLENLVTLPTGCGEQNMVKFAPNVVVIEVLTYTKQLMEKMETRIKRNLVTGAQRQLQYKHPDGSFSAFGTRDKEGSMFLTAMVLRYFSEAEKYITIDNATLVRMQEWIVSKQQADGCFPDVGKIIDRGIQGGLEKDKGRGAITAFVLISLFASNYQNETVMDKAFSCIAKSEDKSFYATFLYAYAEALAGKEESAKERLQSVKERIITKGKTEYYHDTNATKSQDIETNSYAILALLKSGSSASDALPIVQYLTQNMNPQGGFYSTQDTCVGMEALGEFSKLTVTDPIDIKVKVTGGLNKEIQILEDEKLLLKRYKILEVPSEVEVEATGTGCAVLQKVVRYNTKTPPEKRNFNLEAVGMCTDEKCKKGTISISVSYIPEDKKTGMSIVEVKMISGVVPVKESLERLNDDKSLKLMRYDVEDNTVIFYFWEISDDEKSFFFEVERLAEVEDSQPGTVKVYDYYNRDISSSTTYTLGNCGESASCSKEP